MRFFLLYIRNWLDFLLNYIFICGSHCISHIFIWINCCTFILSFFFLNKCYLTSSALATQIVYLIVILYSWTFQNSFSSTRSLIIEREFREMEQSTGHSGIPCSKPKTRRCALLIPNAEPWSPRCTCTLSMRHNWVRSSAGHALHSVNVPRMTRTVRFQVRYRIKWRYNQRYSRMKIESSIE